jgi:flavin-dependent dehydrogenase
VINFDVVVVGGGVAGSTAALCLARTGCRTAVVEANPASRWRIGETLGPESRRFLQTLALWDAVAQGGHLASHGKISAWGSSEALEEDFIFNPFGNAWQLDRRQFEESLWQAATEAGAKGIRGEAVEGLERMNGSWTIGLGEERVRTPWVLDATGRSCRVARRLGFKRLMLDQLVAVYAIAQAAQSTDNDSRTLVESCADGWWYSALTPHGLRTVSFQTDADLLPAQQWRKPAWFQERLSQTKHVAPLLAQHGYHFDAGPQLTSAHSGRSEAFGGEGWAAIGDAAMSFDPLSGLGIIKAMKGAVDVAQAVGSGDSATFEKWIASNEKVWEQYLAHRHQNYAMEKRWHHEPFWRRRAGGSAH